VFHEKKKNTPEHILLLFIIFIYANENEDKSGCSLESKNLSMKTLIGSTANQYL
jgi:hypothetical protein